MTQAIADQHASINVYDVDPIMLDLVTLQLSPVVFRPFVTIQLSVTGMSAHSTAAEKVLTVNLVVEHGTVGYARQKVESVLLGANNSGDGSSTGGGDGDGDISAMYKGRLYMIVVANATDHGRAADDVVETVKLRKRDDGRLLSSYGSWTAGGTARTVKLRYERRRTAKGVVSCAPRVDDVVIKDFESGGGGGGGGSGGGGSFPLAVAYASNGQYAKTLKSGWGRWRDAAAKTVVGQSVV